MASRYGSWRRRLYPPSWHTPCWRALSGFANLRAGISAYGLATAFCPWWPTGLGVLGLLGALGEAVVIAAVLSIPFRRRYPGLPWLAVPGGILYLTYLAYQNWHALTDPGLSFLGRAAGFCRR